MYAGLRQALCLLKMHNGNVSVSFEPIQVRYYTGEYTFLSYMPGVITVERFLHWWQVASRDSR
jgi:hypothetical protein